MHNYKELYFRYVYPRQRSELDLLIIELSRRGVIDVNRTNGTYRVLPGQKLPRVIKIGQEYYYENNYNLWDFITIIFKKLCTRYQSLFSSSNVPK